MFYKLPLASVTCTSGVWATWTYSTAQWRLTSADRAVHVPLLEPRIEAVDVESVFALELPQRGAFGDLAHEHVSG